MEKYSKRSVVVHWLTLVLLVAAAVLGDGAAEARESGHPALASYMAHILAGNLILLLTLARLYFRGQDGVPAALGNTPMDKVAKGIQHTLYLVLILLPLSGVAIVLNSGIGKALFAGDATLVPKDLDGLLAHNVHETLVAVLVALVLVHLLGALKHQFVLKDGIMDRMSLRTKK